MHRPTSSAALTAGPTLGGRGVLLWLASGPWLFPLLVLGTFVALCATGISGTSSGALWHYLNGAQPDPRLLLGHPRGIRSDEWLVNTPMIVAQAAAGFPRTNEAVGTGLDMSLIHDVPYRDWSLLFRPQSWGFLVLPLDQAFAFRWWLLAVVLVLAVYALSSLLLPGQRLLASCLAGALFLAPFTQWWYISQTLGSLGWSTAAVATFLWLLRAQRGRDVVLRAGLLFWVTTCFALVQYPPFQIPCILVVGALTVGLLVMHWREDAAPGLGRRVGAGVAAVGAAGLVVIAFLATRLEAVEAIASSDYPGERRVEAGGGSLVRLFYGVLTPVLQLPEVEAATALPELGGNPSEASAFLLVGLCLLAVDAWLLTRARRLGLPVNAALVALGLVTALFLSHTFLASTNLLSRLTLLSLVPVERLQLGFGLVSTLLVLVTVWECARQDVRPPWWLAGASAAAALLLSLEVVARVVDLSPAAVPDLPWALLSAMTLALVVLLFARGLARAGAVVLVVASALSSVTVNPVYRGVFDVRETAVGQAVRAADDGRPGKWVSTAGLLANAVLVESGVETWSAVSAYPEVQEWSVLDPSGRHRSVYNRYGHVVFTPDLPGEPLQNPQEDVIAVDFEACGGFVAAEVSHVLASSALDSPCLRPVSTVPMPGVQFHIYAVVAAAKP